MKKRIAIFFFLIFLTGFTIQLGKNFFCNESTIENVLDEDTENEKKQNEDLTDFLKNKISIHYSNNVAILFMQQKKYIEYIFQYKNPHNDLDVIPPEYLI